MKSLPWLYINSSSIATKDDFRQTTLSELRKLPIRIIDKTNKHIVDKTIEMVDEMLILNEQKLLNISPEKIEQLNQRIVYADEKINKLVYELYGLSEEEIRIVEGR